MLIRIEAYLELTPVPAGWFNLHGQLKHFNQLLCDYVGLKAEQLSDMSLEGVAELLGSKKLGATYKAVINGTHEKMNKLEEQDSFYSIYIVASRFSTTTIDGALFFARHINENIILRKKEKEFEELKKAISHHTILSITDAQGYLTFVNDKFCEITQYSRKELYGNSYTLIKSTEHSSLFFTELWHTISAGRVWQGEICNRNKSGQDYWVYMTIVPSLDEKQIPVKYISLCSDITHIKTTEKQAKQLALYDTLTGLANRRLLGEQLGLLLHNSNRLAQYHAVLSLDLDHFKSINDFYGHAKGDVLLQLVAQRLKGTLRESDIIARIGGDEYIVVLTNLGPDPLQARTSSHKIAHALLMSLTEAYQLADNTAHKKNTVLITTSIGVTLFSTNQLTADELLLQSDIALYEAKETGRNQVVFFESYMQDKLNARTRLEFELHRALENQELLIYYQPIVNERNECVGVEALLRWNHPTKGIIPPEQFIEIAENSGLIVPIGQWLLQRVCAQLLQWESCAVRSTWFISINSTSRQLREGGFAQRLIALLQSTQLSFERVILETNENLFLESFNQAAIKELALLRSFGVRIALDGFGTGHASLSHLPTMELDMIKINSSLLNQAQHLAAQQEILSAIIKVAQSIKLQVIADGIESAAQLHHIKQLGVTLFQGLFLGPPVSANQLGLKS